MITQAIPTKRRRNAVEIHELLSRFHQSDLTRAEFVRTEGICLATLAKYLKKETVSEPGPSGRFLEVGCASQILGFGQGASYRISLKEGTQLDVPPGFYREEVAGLLQVILAATSGAR